MLYYWTHNRYWWQPPRNYGKTYAMEQGKTMNEQKLYGGDTRLYTAAEARRIDIERGGEGIICSRTGELKYRLDEIAIVWRSKDRQDRLLVPEAATAQQWLPITPEPKAEKEEAPTWEEVANGDRQRALEALEEMQDQFGALLVEKEQLEKELEATLEKSLKHKRDAESCKQELAELTRKFDELKEKQRQKPCKYEFPETGIKIVFYVPTQEEGFFGEGYYNSFTKTYILLLGSTEVIVDNNTICSWEWRYKADL